MTDALLNFCDDFRRLASMGLILLAAMCLPSVSPEDAAALRSLKNAADHLATPH